VAGREPHAFEVAHVPGRDDQAAAVGIAGQFAEHVGELVVGATVGALPGTPLPAVDRAEVAIEVGPFVPDRDAVPVQIADIGVAAEEPQQLVHDGFEMKLLGRDEGETLGEVETQLRPEDRQGAGPGPVLLGCSLGQHGVEEIEVALHALVRSARRAMAQESASLSTRGYRDAVKRAKADQTSTRVPSMARGMSGRIPTIDRRLIALATPNASTPSAPPDITSTK